MTTPFFELKFDKNAKLTDTSEFDAITTALQSGNYTDVLIISHGWNNDYNEARELYDTLLQFIDEDLSGHPDKDKSFMFIGIYWPSKKFNEKQLKEGNAVAVNDKSAVADTIKHCNELNEFISLPDASEALKNIIESLEKKSENSQTLATQVINLYRAISLNNEEKMDEEAIQYYDIENVTMILEDPDFLDAGEVLAPGMGGASSIFNDMLNGINNLLNLATYYQMKERAGLIGVEGLNPVIKEILNKFNVKIHLVGHSFGARLVTAAVSGNDQFLPLQIQSMSLIQAAFSHYGFAENYDRNFNGLFRNIIEKRYVSGPTIVTHTRNDTAVGIAYALASRIAKQVASALGDKDDFYGGLGSNGAQKTPEANDESLLSADGKYSFNAGGIYNLKADRFIKDHSDIKKPEVAKAIVAAMFT